MFVCRYRTASELASDATYSAALPVQEKIIDMTRAQPRELSSMAEVGKDSRATHLVTGADGQVPMPELQHNLKSVPQRKK